MAMTNIDSLHAQPPYAHSVDTSSPSNSSPTYASTTTNLSVPSHQTTPSSSQCPSYSATNLSNLSPIYEGEIFASPATTISPSLSQTHPDHQHVVLFHHPLTHSLTAASNLLHDASPTTSVASSTSSSNTPTPTSKGNGPSSSYHNSLFNVPSTNHPPYIPSLGLMNVNRSKSSTSQSPRIESPSPTLDTTVSPVTKMDLIHRDLRIVEDADEQLEYDYAADSYIYSKHRRKRSASKYAPKSRDVGGGSGVSPDSVSNMHSARSGAYHTNPHSVDSDVPRNVSPAQYSKPSLLDPSIPGLPPLPSQSLDFEPPPTASTAPVSPLNLTQILLTNPSSSSSPTTKGTKPSAHCTSSRSEPSRSRSHRKKRKRRKSTEYREYSDSDSELQKGKIQDKIKSISIRVPGDPNGIYNHWKRRTSRLKTTKSDSKLSPRLNLRLFPGDRPQSQSADMLRHLRRRQLNTNPLFGTGPTAPIASTPKEVERRARDHCPRCSHFECDDQKAQSERSRNGRDLLKQIKIVKPEVLADDDEIRENRPRERLNTYPPNPLVYHLKSPQTMSSPSSSSNVSYLPTLVQSRSCSNVYDRYDHDEENRDGNALSTKNAIIIHTPNTPQNEHDRYEFRVLGMRGYAQKQRRVKGAKRKRKRERTEGDLERERERGCDLGSLQSVDRVASSRSDTVSSPQRALPHRVRMNSYPPYRELFDPNSIPFIPSMPSLVARSPAALSPRKSYEMMMDEKEEESLFGDNRLLDDLDPFDFDVVPSPHEPQLDGDGFYFHPQSAPPNTSAKDQYLSPYRELISPSNSDCKWSNDDVDRLPLPLQSLSDPNPSVLKNEEVSLCPTPRRMVIQSPSIHPSMVSHSKASSPSRHRRHKLKVLVTDIGGHGVGNLVDL